MSEDESPSCGLCNIREDDQLRFGQLFQLEEVAVHHFCLLFSPHMQQNGKDDEGAEGFLEHDIKTEIVRAAPTICSYCNKGGATSHCMSLKCSKKYHVGCVVQANGLLQFFGKFKSFCEEHRPRQNVIGGEQGEACSICLDQTDTNDQHNVLWTPCCKHFFHRACLQRMAYHFGYFFYCPGCRNKDSISGFLRHMRHFGIFIPKRDASWEMVPNAFGELLERHLMCDVRYCLCVQGRQHQASEVESPWRLCVCETCGSAGTHLACSDLPETITRWVCPACTLQPEAPSNKCTLRTFFERRPGKADEGSSSGRRTLSGPLSLHEVLGQLEEPEQLVKFTISPISGLSVATRRLVGERTPVREPGGRPVQYHPLELLPEAAITADDQRQAELRLWSENHVAAPETGGHCSYEPTQRRQASEQPAAPRRAAPTSSAWTSVVDAHNHRPPAAGPSPAPPLAVLAGLPPTAELRAALATLQCPGCQQHYKLLSELTYHYQSHSGDALFYCKLCQERTSQWGSFHVLDHHPELAVEEWAQYVDSTFERAQALMIRLLLNRRGIRVTLEQARCIHAHFRTLVGGRGGGRVQVDPGGCVTRPPSAAGAVVDGANWKDYDCPECGAVLRSASVELVTAHKFMHSDEACAKYADRPHHCGDCHFGTGFPYMVSRHRQRHHQKRRHAAHKPPTVTKAPMVTPVVSAPAVSQTEPSEVTSTGTIECPDCGKMMNPVKVKKHAEWHTEAMRRSRRALSHHCPKCYYASNSIFLVTRHVQKVHGLSPDEYRTRCPRCSCSTFAPDRHQCTPGSVDERPHSEASNPTATSSALKAASLYSSKAAASSVRSGPSALDLANETSPLVQGPLMLPPEDGSLTCQKCGKVAKDDIRFRNHVFFHSAQAEKQMRCLSHHCTRCFYASDKYTRVYQHLVRHHQVDAVLFSSQCTKCKMCTFDMKRHICKKKKREDEKYDPSAVPKAASKISGSTKSKLSTAKFVGKKPHPLRCVHCGKMAYNKAKARLHAYWHTAEAERKMQHMTQHCPKCFYASDKLVRIFEHLRTVHGVNGIKRQTLKRRCMKCGDQTYNLAKHCVDPVSPLPDEVDDPDQDVEDPGAYSPDEQKTNPAEVQSSMTSKVELYAKPTRTCEKCGREGLSIANYCAHMHFHTTACKEEMKNLVHHCPLCFFASNVYKAVTSHVAKFHKKSPREYVVPCKRCDVSTFNLERHKCALPSCEKGICKHCGIRGNPEQLADHAFWHSKEAEITSASFPWVCPLCYYAENEARKIYTHLENDHLVDPSIYHSTCNICRGMVFNAEAHEKWHTLPVAQRFEWSKFTSGSSGSVCNLPQARDSAVKRASSVKRDSSVVVPISSLMASGRIEKRHDCPFCDGFFHSHTMYTRHMIFHHKVGGDSSTAQGATCRFKYCVTVTDNPEVHEQLYHKTIDRKFGCSMCDCTFREEKDRAKHERIRHAGCAVEEVVQLPSTGHCWCRDTEHHLGNLRVSKHHLLQAHSVMIRGAPGPRFQLYMCPECKGKYSYEDLIHHMASQHCWPFKMSGDEITVGVGGSAYAVQKRWTTKLRCPECTQKLSFTKMFEHLQNGHKWTFLDSTCDKKGNKGVASQKALKPARSVVANKLLKKAIQQPRLSKPKNSEAMGSTDIRRNVYDCPFCDAFFETQKDYLAHGRRAHSGLAVEDPTSVCPVQYCYLPQRGNGHRGVYHKNPDGRVLPCNQCSGAYTSKFHLERHRNSLHANRRPGIRVVGGAECHCDVSNTRRKSMAHAWTYHGGQCRAPTGPRAEPYICPVCGENLHFDMLTLHLRNKHGWKLKTSGSVVFGSGHQARGSLTGIEFPRSQDQRLPEQERLETVDDTVCRDYEDAGECMVGFSEHHGRVQSRSTSDGRVSALLSPSQIKQEDGSQGVFDPQSVSVDVKQEVVGDDQEEKEQTKAQDVKRWSIKEITDNPNRLDCPFCDSFFTAKHHYQSHMLRVHSGVPGTMDTSGFRQSTCTARYCMCQGTVAHMTQYHKGSADCAYRCWHCDRWYRTIIACQQHMKKNHFTQEQQGRRERDTAHCLCDITNEGKWCHMVRNHSIQVRSYPGPRSDPYSCPSCDKILEFSALVRHLKGVHKWPLKETGEEAFGKNRLDNRNFQRVPSDAGDRVAGDIGAEEYDDNADMLEFESGALDELEDEFGQDIPTSLDTGTSSSSATGTIPSVFPCPFCDAFFLHKAEYSVHAEAMHAGTKQSGQCEIAFCYGNDQTRHLSRMHKSSERMLFQCPKCEATFQSRKLVVKHLARIHRPNVKTSLTATTGAEAQFATLCSCDVCPRLSHIQMCHSVSVRGEPGPRAEPYECPMCPERLLFTPLLTHLTQWHGWRLKLTGLKAFRSPVVIPDSVAHQSGAEAPEQQQIVTSEAGKKRLKFVCHFCPFAAARFEVRDHERFQHVDETRAYKSFAATCMPAESEMFVCPFCSYSTPRIWQFHHHLTKSEFCRSCLDSGAQLWVAKSPVLKGPPPVTSSSAEAETSDGGTKTAAGTPMKVKLWTNSKRTLSKPAHHALAWKKSKPVSAFESVRSRQVYSCHFCPAKAPNNPSMVHHQRTHHPEAYAGFLKFARTVKMGDGKTATYHCPSCNFSYVSNKVWRLKDHLLKSQECQGALSPADASWLQPESEEIVGTVEYVPSKTEPQKVQKTQHQRKVGHVQEQAKKLPFDGSRRRVYRCNFCPRKFNSTRDVTNHQGSAHGEAYLSFKRFADRCRHKETGEFFCRLCGQHFHKSKMWDLRKHVLKKQACRNLLDPSTDKWLEIDTQLGKIPGTPPRPTVTATEGAGSSTNESLLKTGKPVATPTVQGKPGQLVTSGSSAQKSGRGSSKSLYKCFFCAFSGSLGKRTVRTKHMWKHHADAVQAFMDFSDSCKHPNGQFICPVCGMSKPADRRWELRDHFLIHEECAKSLPPEAAIWLAKSDEVVGGSDDMQNDLSNDISEAGEQDSDIRSAGESAEIDLDFDDDNDGSNVREPAFSVADDLINNHDEVEGDSYAADSEAAETGQSRRGSEMESPVGTGTRRKRKAPEHWQAGSEYKHLTYICHYCAFSGQKNTVQNHERTAHERLHNAYMSFNTSCMDQSKITWCPFCPWRSSPNRRWMLHRHMMDSPTCRSLLPATEHCWLVEGSASARAAVHASNRAQGCVTLADRHEAPVPIPKPSTKSPSSLGHPQKTTNPVVGYQRAPSGGFMAVAKKRKKPPSSGKKALFRCHYCKFRASKDLVWRHQHTEHADAHESFNAFARASRSNSGGHRCPFCPWFRRTEGKWALMRHMAESAECRSRLGPDAQSWVSTVQPASKEKMAQPKGEEVLIPEPSPSNDELSWPMGAPGSDEIEDDPLDITPTEDPLASDDDPLILAQGDATSVCDLQTGSQSHQGFNANPSSSNPLPAIRLLPSKPRPNAEQADESFSRSLLKSSVAIQQGGNASPISILESAEVQSSRSLLKPIKKRSGPTTLKCRFCAFKGPTGNVYRHRQTVHAEALARFNKFCKSRLKDGAYKCPFCSFMCHQGNRWALQMHMIRTVNCRASLSPEHDCWLQTSEVTVEGPGYSQRKSDMFEPYVVDRVRTEDSPQLVDMFQCPYCTYKAQRQQVERHQKNAHANAHMAFLEFAAKHRDRDAAYSCPHCLYRTLLPQSFLRHFKMLAGCRNLLEPGASAWLPVRGTRTETSEKDDDDVAVIATSVRGSNALVAQQLGYDAPGTSAPHRGGHTTTDADKDIDSAEECLVGGVSDDEEFAAEYPLTPTVTIASVVSLNSAVLSAASSGSGAASGSQAQASLDEHWDRSLGEAPDGSNADNDAAQLDEGLNKRKAASDTVEAQGQPRIDSFFKRVKVEEIDID